LLLFPSRIEGHALAILEAASFGIPALCTNVAPINEYESDPRFLISTFSASMGRVTADVKDGAEKLRTLMDLNWEKKSKSVRKALQDSYSWAALGKIYDEVLK
jgi:glycosyltransferase involved in cell wall biosynthesis